MATVFSCTQQKATKEKINTKTEVAEKKTIPAVKKEKPVSSIPKPKKVKPALDTIIHTLENGDSLFTYIYEYHDTIPGKPIRKFITMNEKDSVVIKSFDKDFVHAGGIPEGNFELFLIPLYILKKESIQINVLKSYSFIGKNEIINFDGTFEKIFDNISFNEINIINFSEVALSKKKIIPNIELKKPSISQKEIQQLQKEILIDPKNQLIDHIEELMTNSLLYVLDQGIVEFDVKSLINTDFNLQFVPEGKDVLIYQYLIMLKLNSTRR